jgi:predicted PurR-regulated permease PerM
VALSLAGLDFGIIIGTAAGILTFIPYLGASLGLIASMIVAFIQFTDHTRIVIVAAVYIVGHLIEANLVTPNLVGDRVKLHPVWIIFALTAGGALFGFTGVLLAVPVAAVIGVLVRFAIREYLDSSFYDNRVASLPLVDRSEL